MPPFAQRLPGPRDGLRGGSLWSFGAGLAATAGQCGLLVVTARLGSPEMVGRYALATALAGPPPLLANLQLRNVLVSDTAGRFAWGVYGKLRAATTALATIVVVILAAAVLGGFERPVYQPDYARHPDLLFWLTVAGAAGALGSAMGAAVTAAGVFAPQPAPYALAAASRHSNCHVIA